MTNRAIGLAPVPDRGWRRAALTMALVLAMAPAAMALDVALTVQETAGVARVQDPCRTGVPLPPGAVSDVAKLALADAKGSAVPAQFRVMHTRPAGDIEWVCVDFLADVPAKGSVIYRLTDRGGAKAPAKPLVATQADKAVTVVTGPLKAVLPTDGFAGLGQVWLDANGDGNFTDDEKVATGGGLVIDGMDGKVYRSASDLDGPVKVTLEESGPLHVVVRIDGKVKVQSADGKSHTYPQWGFEKTGAVLKGDVTLQNQDQSLGFTVRLHFWLGQSWVRSFVTMRNLKGESSTGTDKEIRLAEYLADTVKKPGNLVVDGVNLELTLPDSAKSAYRIGGGIDGTEAHAGQLAGPIDGVTLFQCTAASWLYQVGSGKIFDPRLQKNKEWMDANTTDPVAKGKAYWEYDPVWYNELATKRDGGNIMGYRLYRGAKDVAPGAATSDKDLGAPTGEGMRAPGWAELDNGKTAVTVACRWFWQMFPKSLELTANKMTIGLWPKWSDRGHVFEGTIHKTHEVVIDFRPTGKGLAAEDRYKAFDQRLMAVADGRHYLASRAFGDFMLPNKEEWPRLEGSALAGVVCGVDPSLPPGQASSFEVEREKYNHFGVWTFGDHSKDGFKHFSQYLELDNPYCLIVNFVRSGDLRYYREAEIATREVLDVPAHGGGYGHQKGEPSHYYTYGPLMFSYLTAEPFLKDSVLASYRSANPNPWHIRSFGMTTWSSLDIMAHFPEMKDEAIKRIQASQAWWKKNQNPTTGELGGYAEGGRDKTFFLGIGTDAMGRYCEAFPEDKEARTALVAACKEWIGWVMGQDAERQKKLLNMSPGNGFAFATRFSGDQSFMDFAEKHLVLDSLYSAKYRNGTASGKAYSEYGHRTVHVFLHDLDKKRHPEKYKDLP